jgi:kumamolisin
MIKSYIRFPKIKFSAAQSLSYYPTQVAELYKFPKRTGKGCKIGFIELGGGYAKSDLNTFFHTLNLPVPIVKDRLIDGATNSPDGINGAQGEVTLDIEVGLAVAPQAEGIVYFAPNSNDGFLNAIKAAIADKVDAISISWGGPENQWSPSDMHAYDAVFHATNIPIFVAAGDNGSGDGESGQHVDFPGSSPHVICCGGTTLIGNVSSSGIQSETVWNDGSQGGATGGGFSAIFGRPSYQSHIGFTSNKQRGVPDIAGNADPNTGYNCYIAGQWLPIGGTSACAPLFAGLYCLLKEALGNANFFLGFLYQYHQHCIRDITEGNNGAYKSAKGWDACTGWGVPVGEEMLQELAQAIGPPVVVP